MRATMYGAACEVTGSAYLLQTDAGRLLIDCGLFQGGQKLERLNFIPKQLNPGSLDAVLLTHGHLDHCGRLPLLIKGGYKGPVYATSGTIDIARLILLDAARIQESDTERENRRRQRAGLRPLAPLFDTADAERVFKHFREVAYDKPFEIADALVTFVDAGHILGSGSIEVVSGLGDRRRTIVFSGDLGQYDAAMMRDPARIDGADIVFVESTYGDRDHKSQAETVLEFQGIIKSAAEKRSKVLIPTFAVGRAQQILFHLAEMFRNKLVEPLPVYLDSPMAISASRTYARHAHVMDTDVIDLVGRGQLQRDLATLVACETAEQSQALNAVPGPCIILAGAGMCNAGRILHHFKHNLWREDCCVVIVGFQTRGSLGRMLVEGEKKVKIFGETVVVRATVHSLGGFSAHAGQTDLLRWLQPMTGGRVRVILTHGEGAKMQVFAQAIRERFGVVAEMPKLGEELEL